MNKPTPQHGLPPLHFTLALACAFSGAALSSTAAADRAQFVDYAQVKEVRPVYRTVEHHIPQRSCWDESVRIERPYSQPRQHNSATSTLVGGMIGGALGHAVGRGHDNKKIGTAVGAVLGMSIGNDIGHKNRPSTSREAPYGHDVYEHVERCDVSYRKEIEEQLIGYDVTYKYRGETFSTRTRHHPGERIKLAISVNPLEQD